MTNLPTGTVTFLFTDIEGSTNIAQAYPGEWERLRGRHHEILHSAIESNNGCVFQIVGDEFCAAFFTAADALSAALLAQQMLQSEDWQPVPIKVRMGVNTGTAQVGDVTDTSGGYTGYAALARVNRVMSAGHGGQVLLSNTSAELVRGELPPHISLRDMKEQRLKGLLNPEHLWQAESPGLAHEFPPLKTLNAIPNNLPAQLTSFIGREKAIVEVKEELNTHRLVTLVGPGGTGKSRLSLQVAAEVLDAYPDGIWHIELASLSDPNLVVQAIISALAISEQKGNTALQTLEEYMHDKSLLIILDNCEHLIEACANISEAILRAAPNVKIMASSCVSLGVNGEVAWHVPALSLPNPKNLPDLNLLTEFECVRLFIDRVLLVSPRFTINKDNASVVAQICYRLDGIPLAVELAATRAKSMTVEQIMAHLDDRFRLLTGGSRTSLPHQQTLRALIDWSYELLTDAEKLLLRRLSVFAGGWTLELAEQVSADEKLDSFDILDMLGHLVDKSLVALEEENGSTRYRIIETIRQYAREKLFESDEKIALRNRHRDAFLNLAEQAEPELNKNNAKEWFRVLDAEQENIRSALSWSLENHDANSAMRMCDALDRYWVSRELYREAVNFCNETLTVVEKDEALMDTVGYALLLAERTNFEAEVSLNLLTNPATREIAQKVATLLERFKFPHMSFRGFRLLANTYMAENDLDAAEQVMLKSLNGSRSSGNQEDVAWSLSGLADIYWEKDDVERSTAMDIEARDVFSKNGCSKYALQHADALSLRDYLRGNLGSAQKNLEASLHAYQDWGDDGRTKYTLWTLAEIACRRGDFELTRKYYLEAGVYSKKFGEQIWEKVEIQFKNGELAFVSGELENAYRIYKSILESLEQNQADEFSGYVLETYGLTLLRSGQMEEARTYLVKSIDQRRKVGQGNDIDAALYGLGDLERIAGNISASILNYQNSLFLRNKRQEYIYFTELFDGFAKVAILQDDFAGSARWFGLAECLRNKFGTVIFPVDRSDYDMQVEMLKSQMSAEEFASAWTEGAKMKMEDAVMLALQGYEPEK